MKNFDFFSLASKEQESQYWSLNITAAEHFYESLGGKKLTNKDIKNLWKQTGPKTLLEKIIFKPDYRGIKYEYNKIKFSLNRVQSEINDKISKSGEMLPHELELEDRMIAQGYSKEFKENAQSEFARLNKNSKNFKM